MKEHNVELYKKAVDIFTKHEAKFRKENKMANQYRKSNKHNLCSLIQRARLHMVTQRLETI